MRTNKLLAVAILLVSSLLSLGASCGKPHPPNPTPTPTPTPPVGTPDKGIPILPSMLLRTEGVTTKGVKIAMAQPCCMQFVLNGKDENSRWPMASESFMDWTHQYGINAYGFRFGPFRGDNDHETEWADTGGSYKPGTLEWNPAFWQRSRDLTYHALKSDSYVLVAPLDTWGCKDTQNGSDYMPLPKSEIDSCGRNPSPEIERHIRKVVEEVGCFGNVIWTTDIEGGNIRGNQISWFLWVRDVIRSEEQKSGCGFVHMIGTNSNHSEVESQVDFVLTHERSPLSAPISGRFTLNDEHNPAFPPEEEAALFSTARDAGQSWGLWRAEQTDSQYTRTLELVKGVIDGAITPGCFAPAADDPLWGTPSSPTDSSQTWAWVREAEAIVGDRSGVSNPEMYQTLGLLAAELRKKGHCASGPWADALAVKREDGSNSYEEIHAVAFTTGGYVTNPSTAFKNIWPYNGTPPSPSASCTDPIPTRDRMKWAIVQHNNIKDATPLVGPRSYCDSAGFENRNECPTRPEGTPEVEACNRLLVGGDPLWSSDGDTRVRSNPYQATCLSCTWLEVCTADSAVCGRVSM